MAWPSDRLTTYAAGSQLKSADMNAIQDAIIAGSRGQRTLLIPIAAAQGNISGGALDGDSNYLNSHSGAVAGAASGIAGVYSVDVPIILFAGEVIQEIRARILEANAAGETIEAKVWEQDASAGTSTQKGPTRTSGISGGAAVLLWSAPDAGFPITTVAGRAYIVSIKLPTTSAPSEAVARLVEVDVITP